MGKKFIVVSYKNSNGSVYTKTYPAPLHWVKVLGVSLYENQPAKRLSIVGKEAE
jgi:hypothetical protein